MAMQVRLLKKHSCSTTKDDYERLKAIGDTFLRTSLQIASGTV